MAEKIAIIKKYFTGGSLDDFLAAADKADKAEKKMLTTKQEFAAESLKAAEDAVNSSLNLSNTLDMVSDQILAIASQTKDETLKAGYQGGNG